MKTPEEAKGKIIEQWLAKADADLAAAKLFISEERSFYYIVAFLTQQAAEKYIKAYLTWHEIDFPKTHDIDLLLDLAATKDLNLAESLRPAYILSDYAVDFRYPGDFPDPTKSEAQEAISLAEKVRDEILREVRKEK